MILLGVDPGSRVTGYGILETKERGFRVVEYGCIKAPAKAEIGQRLHTIYRDLEVIISQYTPEELVLEEAFFAKNAKSALVLGQVRGVVMLAASQKNIHVVEISAKLVKKRITGNGNASKEQVRDMVCQRLRLEDSPRVLDASDALAIALAHGQEIHYV